jgi:abequosyltransferase
MQEITPLLTIAIPSNNKTELLDLAIASIVSQFTSERDCEICISDNSIGNSTERLLREKYFATHQISYNRTLDAPSLDENVNKAVNLSKGEYVWLFGDDDLIVEGALDKVINQLIDFSPDILILNSLSFDQFGVIEDSRTVLKESKNYGTTDNDVFLAELGGYLTYIGGIVVRRELWVKHFRSETVGSYFAHIDTIFSAKVGRTASYIATPCIQMRLHSQTWSSKHYKIWNLFFPKTIWSLVGYSDDAKRSVTPQVLINSLKSMLSSRAYGRFNMQIYNQVIVNCPQASRATKFFGLLIAILPRHLLRHLYIYYVKGVKNKRSVNFSPRLALAQLLNKD